RRGHQGEPRPAHAGQAGDGRDDLGRRRDLLPPGDLGERLPEVDRGDPAAHAAGLHEPRGEEGGAQAQLDLGGGRPGGQRLQHRLHRHRGGQLPLDGRQPLALDEEDRRLLGGGDGQGGGGGRRRLTQEVEGDRARGGQDGVVVGRNTAAGGRHGGGRRRHHGTGQAAAPHAGLPSAGGTGAPPAAVSGLGAADPDGGGVGESRRPSGVTGAGPPAGPHPTSG